MMTQLLAEVVLLYYIIIKLLYSELAACSRADIYHCVPHNIFYFIMITWDIRAG